MKNLVDCYILSFKSNEPRLIDMVNGEIEVVGNLKEITKGKAFYVGKDEHNRIEIAIPITVFLEIQHETVFEILCTNLERFRISQRTVLGYMTTPMAYIDNDLRTNQSSKD